MTILDYFDIHNVEHLKAYEELMRTGIWPKRFWENNKLEKLDFPQCWQISLSNKMASDYIRMMIRMDK